MFTNKTTENGCYQHNSGTDKSAQMTRLKLPVDTEVFPEVSGSKHCFNVRFLMSQDNEVAAS